VSSSPASVQGDDEFYQIQSTNINNNQPKQSINLSDGKSNENVAFEADTAPHCSDLTIKFDTGASHSMSGVPDRISVTQLSPDIAIRGFNSAISTVQAIGRNDHGIDEFFVSDMPDNLVLLCAHQYVSKHGAAILFKDEGIIIDLNKDTMMEFKDYINQYPVAHKLHIRNKTYELADEQSSHQYQLLYDTSSDQQHEQGFSAAPVQYFNSKINVSSVEERILALLISGLTIENLIKYVKHGSVSGLHPDITLSSLHKFSRKYGYSPDAVQLAIPNKQGNVKGYLAPSKQLTQCGEVVEMDFFDPDFNEPHESPSVVSTEDNAIRRKKVKKLSTHGGAIAANVYVDAYSGYVQGTLVKSTARPLQLIEDAISKYEAYHHPVQLFAADSGVSSQSEFRVFVPEVERYLLSKKIKTRRAEPYNHSNGCSHDVENIIRSIKVLIRVAIQYVMRNTNIQHLQYTPVQLLRLWGELFYWSMTVLNLRISPHSSTQSAYEMFTGEKPNIQDIRILPIFATLLVYRTEAADGNIETSNRPFYRYGLYVGPDVKIKGGIRVAIRTSTRGEIRIISTTKYKAVSDGGGINISEHVNNGIIHMVQDVQGDVAPHEVSVQRVFDPGGDVGDDYCHAQDEAAVPDITALDSGSSSNLDSPIPSIQAVVNPQEVILSQPAAAQHQHQQRRRREIDRSKWLDREQRMQRRNAVAIAESADHIVDACFADWSTFQDSTYYYAFECNTYIHVTTDCIPASMLEEIGLQAVTVGVPKSYKAALEDPKWGGPARLEWQTLIDSKAIVEVDSKMAKDAISQGADVVILFPIYERKIKEGKEVFKVRLVGNGKTQYRAGSTYSPTPSREEFLLLMHIVAVYDWEYVHIDESRAFLNATYKGETPVYARLAKDSRMFKVDGALYGLKTSPRDYNQEVITRLTRLGLTQLQSSSCIFVQRDAANVLLVFDFVDDFVITSNQKSIIEDFIERFRALVVTTEPSWNSDMVLGMQLTRNRMQHTIEVSMEHKVDELCNKFNINSNTKKRYVPMPQHGYIVNVEQLDEQQGAILSNQERETYMQIVGSLIWISGIRGDILFSVMYLTWYTKQPRRHHMVMAFYLMAYLYHTKHIPLVLGGNYPISVHTYTDSSLGTGPKGRSISGQMSRLNPASGSIHAKSTASTLVSMSSFESELDAATSAIKSLSRISTVLEELGIDTYPPQLYSDNEAMVNFVKGQGVAKGVRHIELRMWYTREQFKQGKFCFDYMPGKELPADKLTKLATREDHEKFRHHILGLGLLGTPPSLDQQNTADASREVETCANQVAHVPKGV